MRTVTINLHGELGNQMFQWALGYSINKKYGVKIKYQLIGETNLRLKSFKLNDLPGDQIDPVELSELESNSRIFPRVWNRMKRDSSQIFREKNLHFDYLPIEETREIHGYFQSWRYFDNYREELKEHFQVTQPSTNYLELESNLGGKFTALHIRRGGDGAAKLTADYHGLLPATYYQSALRLGKRLGFSQRIVVFTDNPTKANTLLSEAGIDPFLLIGPSELPNQNENLILMSKASSIIGANSSYSWWSAYLSPLPIGFVIFPRQWYMNAAISNSDMLLPDWISLGFKKFENEQKERGL